jgi:periplasmic protein TonB
MIKKIFLLFCIFTFKFSFAQMLVPKPVTTPLLDYNVIDVQPQYKGGFKEFLNYVQQNFKPETEGASGVIKVDFIFDVNGFISSVKIKNDVGGAGKLLAKVLEKSPKWDAGEEEGQKVRVIYHDFSITINN